MNIKYKTHKTVYTVYMQHEQLDKKYLTIWEQQ